MTNLTIKDKLREQVTNLLIGDYGCTRVWEAWQVGTMTQNDFVPLEETERVDEIMQLIESAITEARLDELDRIASPSNKASVHPNAGFDYFIGWGVSEIYVKDRIAQLKDNTSV